MKLSAWFSILLLIVLLSLSLAHGTAAQGPRPGISSTPWTSEWADYSRQFRPGPEGLALDTAGYPHLAYGGNALFYTWYDGAFWQTQLPDVEPVTDGAAALALDGNDRPGIAYCNATAEQLKYASYDGSVWHIEVVTSKPEGSGCDISLAMDAAGQPHILFYSGDSGLQYASYQQGAWQIETVDGSPSAGRCNSLTLDASGFPHVSYYYQGNNELDLRYAWRDGAGWYSQQVDRIGGFISRESTSVALDAAGRPHIAYGIGFAGGVMAPGTPPMMVPPGRYRRWPMPFTWAVARWPWMLPDSLIFSIRRAYCTAVTSVMPTMMGISGFSKPSTGISPMYTM